MPDLQWHLASGRTLEETSMMRSAALTRSLTALVVVGALTGHTSAQDASPPERPPGPPPTAAEAKAEQQKNSAAKLAGLLAFVVASCPDVRPNTERFKAVVSGLGVAYDELASGELRIRAQAYTEVYSKDIVANCARATENFGPNGRTIPDLIVKR